MLPSPLLSITHSLHYSVVGEAFDNEVRNGLAIESHIDILGWTKVKKEWVVFWGSMPQIF